ncbi:hypothetical protein A3H38_06905 [candidate division WOR-1 bacterium RIFCSPLOWO2_02_FULL_46_20]|nr:MAG: hypothetical protein A3H38_06905 [candidate division WOR-1 bacterium RIFCSPLOWO2_02_FULL_46_20]
MKYLAYPLMLIFCSASLSFADTELWSMFTFQHPVKDGLKIAIIPELRFRNNASEWYYLRTYIGPQISLDKSWEAAVYLAPNLGKSGGSWTTSYLYYLDLIYKNGFFSNRARLEENLLSGVLVYRNSLQFKTGNWTLADELFYNFAKGFLDENRASISYSIGAFSLGYLLRMQKATAAADWVYTNVANLGLKVNF